MAKAIKEYSLPELMDRIEEIFNANPEPMRGFEAIVQYDVHGEQEGIYTHTIKDCKLTIKEGVDPSVTPKVTMKLSYDDFKKFVLGKQSGTMALMLGKVKVKGDIATGLKIESILRKYHIKEPF